MKKLFIPCLSDLDWSSIEAQRLNSINWNDYSYKPHVSFKAAHNGDTLFIRFEVNENYPVRAEVNEDQGAVYQDSCVEFFLSKPDKHYYNFEFNSKGILLAAKGKDRHNRTALAKSHYNRIKRIPSEIITIEEKYVWHLTIGIPFDIMGIAAGKSYQANFYKCGDLTQEKHYLSWNPIQTTKPDFHRPEFFGEITLE